MLISNGRKLVNVSKPHILTLTTNKLLLTGCVKSTIIISLQKLLIVSSQ